MADDLRKIITPLLCMELQSVLLAIFLLLLPLLVVAIGRRRKSHQTLRNLPPGTTGLPFIGESLDFIRANKTGEQNNFVAKRVLKYGSHTFRTSLFGSEMVVMCGAAANKFLFSNEGKKVELWWPESVQRLIGTSLLTKFGEEGRSDKKMMMHFFSPENLTRWVSTVDDITHRHISSHWEGKDEVTVYPAMKAYTFEIACWLLMSITEPELLSRLAFHFNVLVKGIISLPLNLPGTRFYKAMKAADTIREELRVLLKERNVGMEKKMNGASSMEDLISYMMLKTNGDGRLMPEEEIINNLLDLLFAGHDTSSCVLTLVFKYLAELPHVHQKVLAEQMAIAAAKKGELLQWEDLQKMKYTWSVVCEIMRMTPPVTGAYREALEDFTFEGYTIPKGSKILWSASFTHKDSNYENPTTFDETRFEGSGPPPFSYVPFGGGPRVCLGKEFARLEILIFIHNFICKFDWDLAIPNERVVIDPFPVPVNGLPVRPRPRHLSC